MCLRLRDDIYPVSVSVSVSGFESVCMYAENEESRTAFEKSHAEHVAVCEKLWQDREAILKSQAGQNSSKS